MCTLEKDAMPSMMEMFFSQWPQFSSFLRCSSHTLNYLNDLATVWLR